MCLFGNVGHLGFVTAGYERRLTFLRTLSEDELTDSEHTKNVPSTSVFIEEGSHATLCCAIDWCQLRFDSWISLNCVCDYADKGKVDKIILSIFLIWIQVQN